MPPPASPPARQRLTKQLLDLLTHIFEHVPPAAKYSIALLFLLNMRSWPFVWHFRIFRPIYKAHARILLVRLRHIFTGRMEEGLDTWIESGVPGIPLGKHPFRVMNTYRSWVGPDDGDFNLHMSNSSYAKALDNARFRFASAVVPNIFRCGGGMPLAATHFHFIREIPLFGSYEVRTSIGGWDGKWIWLVHRFVKPPPGSSVKHRSKAVPVPAITATAHTNGNGHVTGNGSANGHVNGGRSASPDDVPKNLLAQARDTPEPDGAKLYTIAVSQMCFKHTRITVPPAIVLAAHGLTSTPATPPAPPPYWEAVRPLVLCARGMPALAEFYKGGWRDVPEGERWWEGVVEGSVGGGEAEGRRQVLGSLKSGLESVRSFGAAKVGV